MPHYRSEPIAAGPFEPSWDSLKSQYRPPDWFRDAKFGIWAHWGPQCQPEAGDWYARRMYMQGHWQSDLHRERYGHPADTGFIDIIGAWKAENWNPDDLLDLYVKAGAKYFVAMANHHDNFDNYASRFHGWNSTRLGPMRDIVGIWAEKARARGLKFGVSNHGAHVWHWWQTAYGYDPEGSRAGERYDASKLRKEDGAGTFWEGLDPQDLYGGPVMPLPDGFTNAKAAEQWHEAHDGVWDEAPPEANPGFATSWYRRCKDLVDSYRPDLLYFDNHDLPLGQAGLDMAAHFYNASLAWNAGHMDVVLNTKLLPSDRAGALVEDVERGFRSEIVPHPWQTDTCIGDWHYRRDIFENKRYKTAAAVIHRLCDVVSKNGNLLLSVPIKGDGTIDSEERRNVEEIGAWNALYGEAIFGSRPWRVSGEGPTTLPEGLFGESSVRPFTGEDVRFTTKDNALYAVTLGRKSGALSLSSLATSRSTGAGQVQRVEIVGAGDASFTRDSSGLHIAIPERAGHGFGTVLRISGSGLL
ncbi:alpha-L-fucosidase [Nostoc sp. 3335mG]|nr:alpha-L-fucosidase [Nostoc sp. 3335mG]